MMWAVVASTIGLLIRISKTVRILGKIFAALLGVAWAVTTYLMVPVLVFEETGVFASIKRSCQLLRKTWGEQVGANIGFGLPFLVLAIPGILLILGGRHQPLALAFALLYFLMLGALMSAVKGIFAVALYRYATEGQAPAGFSQVNLNGSFVSKPQKLVGCPPCGAMSGDAARNSACATRVCRVRTPANAMDFS